MKIIDKLAWIEIKDRKLLITRTRGKETYYIPGGKRETNESDIDALTREIEEELTVQLDTDSLEYFGTFEAQAHGKAEGILVKMTCYTWTYKGQIEPASEIEEFTWFSYDDKHKSSAVDQIIFDYCKNNDLID